MKLDNDLKDQVTTLFGNLKSQFSFEAYVDLTLEKGRDMKEFLTELAELSPLLSCDFTEIDGEARFSISRNGEPLGISFRGVPGGHEFNTLLLAVLNADGIGRNLPDEPLRRRIEAIKGPANLVTFVSLSCTNCPDVAQALNICALLNKGISNVTVDGGQFPEEAERADVKAVPTVFADGEEFSIGRSTLSDLVAKLEERYSKDESATSAHANIVNSADVIVLGGGPAGAAAAIYSARKGKKVAVVAKSPGGSVTLTDGIENLITTQYSTGDKLAATLKENMEHYGVKLYADRDIKEVSLEESVKSITAIDGERFEAPVLIIATGSSPRRMNVAGEDKYTGHGVAYCPHCDGPFFKGKKVAVIGGGNSGIEAAIDLSAICSEVMVFEFLDKCRADEVLMKKAEALGNVAIHTSAEVLEVIGDGSKVTGLKVRNRVTNDEIIEHLDGIFVQIGVLPNSELFSGKLDINNRGEIVTDRECHTSRPGVYAAGDVTDAPFKQIVTAIGEGATAALSAFNDEMRGIF